MATPPTWRGDVQGEADLVEEVARIASLTNLEPKPMARAFPRSAETDPDTLAETRTGCTADGGGAWATTNA